MATKRELTIILDGEQPITWNKFYAGKHWSVRKTEANRVHLLVRSQIDPNFEQFANPVNITVVTYRKDKRRRDPCNIPAKLYIDGLVPLIIEDDSWQYVSSVTTAVRIDKENPRTEIRITEAAKDDII